MQSEPELNETSGVARKIVAFAVLIYGVIVMLYPSDLVTTLLLTPLIMHLYHFYFVYEPQSLLVVAVAVTEQEAENIADDLGEDFSEVLIIKKKET